MARLSPSEPSDSRVRVNGKPWTRVRRSRNKSQSMKLDEPTPPVDVVGGDISIEVAPKAKTFTVSYSNGATDTWPIKAPVGGGGIPAMAVVTTPKYAWSVRSQYYHEADCPAVKRINKANLQTGNIPPPDKKPSSCVKTPAP